MSMSQATEPVNGTLLGERVFVDVIKGLEMRSSWIIWGAKHNNKRLCKRKQRRNKAPWR